MKRRSFPRAYLAPAGVFLALFSPRVRPTLSAQDQGFWDAPTAAGFMGLGCWTGYLSAPLLQEDAERTGDLRPIRLLTTLTGCIAGGYIGYNIGDEVDQRLADGEELPTGLRRGAQMGTVLTGALVASLMSLIPARRNEGRRVEVIGFSALGGALVGGVIQVFLNDRLEPTGSGPSVHVIPTGEGGLRIGLVLGMR